MDLGLRSRLSGDPVDKKRRSPNDPGCTRARTRGLREASTAALLALVYWIGLPSFADTGVEPTPPMAPCLLDGWGGLSCGAVAPCGGTLERWSVPAQAWECVEPSDAPISWSRVTVTHVRIGGVGQQRGGASPEVTFTWDCELRAGRQDER